MGLAGNLPGTATWQALEGTTNQRAMPAHTASGACKCMERNKPPCRGAHLHFIAPSVGHRAVVRAGIDARLVLTHQLHIEKLQCSVKSWTAAVCCNCKREPCDHSSIHRTSPHLPAPSGAHPAHLLVQGERVVQRDVALAHQHKAAGRGWEGGRKQQEAACLSSWVSREWVDQLVS